MATKPLFVIRALIFLTPLLAFPQAALGEERKTLTCVYEDQVYSPGDTIEIDGETLVCDGRTGTWVPVTE